MQEFNYWIIIFPVMVIVMGVAFHFVMVKSFINNMTLQETYKSYLILGFSYIIVSLAIFIGVVSNLYIMIFEKIGNFDGLIVILFVFCLLFLFSGNYRKITIERMFICENCLKAIEPYRKWVCPVCDNHNESVITLNKCKKCKEKLRNYSCPFCNYSISFTKKYNESQLRAKRYE